MQPHQNQINDPKARSIVITKAFMNATKLLGLSTQEIIAMTGISAPSWSRVYNHKRFIEVDTKDAEIALLFIRIFRSLDALFGGNDEASRDWLRAYNHHLEGFPIQLMQSIEGLARVTAYLDAMRGLA